MANLRDLPKVDTLSRSPALSAFPEAVRTQAARAAVRMLREAAMNGSKIDLAAAEELAEQEANRLAGPSVRRVINASGVILHTGVGRARLAKAVAKRLFEIASSHAAVEIDLESGRRGDRQDHVRGLLTELTGAEDAFVVNNCAAAVFLTLTALCAGREVILSRGQMVEIGGSFRMPDIVRQSGCVLVEIGCTNKTRLSDYEEALTENTAALLRCHPSNYRIFGFTETPSLAEMRKLADAKGVLLIEDLGSGCLFDTIPFGIPKEPTLQEAVADGADVVTASGDKMLGGPQAGLILGKSGSIQAIRKHPLARAVRIDKLTLGALEATLKLHATGRQCEIPIVRYLSRDAKELRRIANSWKRAFPGDAVVEAGLSEVGGGSVPGVGLPTYRTGLAAPNPEELAARLRSGEPPILSRIEKDRVWLDPRTVEPDEAREVARILRSLIA